MSQMSTLPSRSTLDLKHKEHLHMFQNQRDTLPNMQEQLDDMQAEYAQLEEQKAARTLGLQGFQRMQALDSEIQLLSNQIMQIETHKREYKYLLKTAPIVHQYFDGQSNRRTSSDRKTTTNGSKKRDLNTLFKQPSPLTKQPTNKDDSVLRTSERTTTKTSTDTTKYRRADLNDKYLAQIDENYLARDKDMPDPQYCYRCDRPMDLDRNEAKLVCLGCGTFTNETLDSDKPSYCKDQSADISNFAYKKINHLNEILAQAQGTENTEIPQKVYDMIIMEMDKERKYNLAVLDYKTVKEYLKKHKSEGFNKHYEHIPHIINRLNGIPPKKFTPVQEENLRNLFKKIQPAFEKHCPKTGMKARNNMLSYNYVLKKLCELLGYDEFLDCFPRLKSDNKLREQEEIWKKICIEMEFQFIPSL